MPQKSIGILGGAGPLAGAILFERVVTLLNKKYGCARDADYPKIFLISYPFSDMLSSDLDAVRIRGELREGLDQLRGSGASVLAIACNTLHAFLTEEDQLDDLVHFPREVGAAISSLEIPLVLCTSSSVRFKLHQRFFPCSYPDPSLQEEVDSLIDLILKDGKQALAIKILERVVESQPASTVVLGCTELSIIAPLLSKRGKTIIDPLEIVANKILERSFNNVYK